MKSLKDKVVVITGGTAGLGRATAEAFAREGCKVAVMARGIDRLNTAERQLRRMGSPRTLGISVDVADSKALDEAAEEVEEILGPIEIWVNNAMTSVFAPLADTAPDEFRRVTEVTYLGAVYGTMVALKRMLVRNRGKIIQVGSALSDRSIPLQAAYCGAKHGIRGFTDSLRSELIHDRSKVQVTMVQMPAMNTPQFGWVRSRLPNKAQPVPPIFQPELGARAVVWAAKHHKRELYVGWPTVKAIWGNKFIRGWLDRYLAKAAWSGQQTSEPADKDRPDNLYQPVGGSEIGAHGEFDARAAGGSAELWAATHKGLLTLSALAVLWLLGMVFLLLGLSRRG